MSIRFFHHGENGKKGGTTVGYDWLDKKSGKMLVTFARVSTDPKSTDVYNKEKGRLVCAGRMRVGKFFQVQKPEGMDKYEFLLKQIEENDQRVKEAYGHKKA